MRSTSLVLALFLAPHCASAIIARPPLRTTPLPSFPTVPLARSPLRADGCWVLRAVDGRACWTPEAYAERVAVAAAAGAATVRVDLERAYDRRDIVLPLSTEARLAVILARQAFELDARADAALFATAPALRRRAVCLTERDRATLEDHGARARATVPVILVALDA